MTIDRCAGGASDAGMKAGGPAAELASVLKSMTRREVRVAEDSLRQEVGGIRLDLIVSGRRDTFGILCDAIEAARLRRDPAAMAELGVRSVYCVSAVDSLLDPQAVAHSIARREPGFFRMPRFADRGRMPVEHIGRHDAPRRLPMREQAGGSERARGSRAA